MKKFSQQLSLVMFATTLTGCTALGMLADSKLDSKQDRSIDPARPQAQQHSPALMSELGMEIDSAIIKGLKKALRGNSDKQKEVCRKNGNITECWPVHERR